MLGKKIFSTVVLYLSLLCVILAILLMGNGRIGLMLMGTALSFFSLSIMIASSNYKNIILWIIMLIALTIITCGALNIYFNSIFIAYCSLIGILILPIISLTILITGLIKKRKNKKKYICVKGIFKNNKILYVLDEKEKIKSIDEYKSIYKENRKVNVYIDSNDKYLIDITEYKNIKMGKLLLILSIVITLLALIIASWLCLQSIQTTIINFFKLFKL